MTTFGQKLIAVMKSCARIHKDGENTHQKYKYSSASAVLEKVNESLCENGLYTSSQIEVISDEMIDTASKRFCQIKMRLTIYDSDSDKSITVESLGSSLNNGDKGVAIAQTMALKYAWRNILQISFDDDDPDATENTDTFSKNKEVMIPNKKDDLEKVISQNEYRNVSLYHSPSQVIQSMRNSVTEEEFERWNDAAKSIWRTLSDSYKEEIRTVQAMTRKRLNIPFKEFNLVSKKGA